jgi:predicted Zn finger-like uncharacterized protein
MANTPLAARCPACHTVFRVVPDQLRVSQGWVRCGRCAEVFNATLSLVDVETGAPRSAAEVLSPHELGIEVVAAHEEPEWAPPTAAAAEADALRDAESDQAEGPALAPAPESAPPTPDAGAGAGAGAGAEHIEPRPEIGPAQDSDLVAPSFLRQAERAARWRQPRVRAALAVLGSLAVVMLAGQILLEYRDLAAARFPGIRPALESTCAALGCRVEAARAINSLAVESSGLVRIERSSIYRLQVALRNRAGIDVALPLLDLSFTDSQGRLIARKVLRPTELGVTQSTLGAGRELALQTTLQTGAGEPISGYTIELFYP